MKKGTIGTVLIMATGLVGAVAAGKGLSRRAEEEHQLAEKHLRIMVALDQWVAVKQEGKNLATYFEKKGYKKIAIYGMSYLGERLLSELKDTEIQVVYGIDKNADNIYSEIQVKSLEDDLDEVDAIVVTAISFFDEIEFELEKRVDCPIVSIEDALYEI